MIFQDRYGNILLSSELDMMAADELERRGIHVLTSEQLEI